MNGYLLDTNIFNHLVEGKIKLDDLPLDYPIFVTHIQQTEFMQFPHCEKRSQLLKLLKVLPDHQANLQTLLADISCAGDACGNGKIYDQILLRLNKIEKRKSNANVHDALIGETSIINRLVLITNDKDFAQAVKSLGGYARNIPSTT
ncbi:MAG: hypothetical protein PHU23_04520 [Dehalococcoidales bacterium]|nr:hypothetical protein [Dehalococcoidales bacterium]